MMPMNIGMSLMMGVMSFNFPSLLVIYWITSGVYQLIQTYFLNVKPVMAKKKEQEQEEMEKVEQKNKFAMPEDYNKKKKKK